MPVFLMVLLTLGLMWPGVQVDIGGDEGLFALQTLRVLNGELPVADFASAYWGGHLYYNVPWFLLLGKSLFAQRVGLIFLCCLYSILLYLLGRRLMSPLWSGIAAIFTILMTFSLYPHMAANWNALICSLAGFLFLLKSFESQGSDPKKSENRLVLSGLFLALSLTMKHTIALYTGFAFFILLILNQFRFFSQEATPPVRSGRLNILGKLLAGLGFLMIPAYLVGITGNHFVPSVLVLFLLPALVLLVETGRLLRKLPFSYATFTRQFLLLLAGSLAGLALFIGPFLISGKLPLLFANTMSQSTQYLNSFFGDLLAHSQQMAHFLWGLFLSIFLLLNRKPVLGYLAIALLVLIVYATTLDSYYNWQQGSLALYVMLMAWILPVGLVILHRQISDLLNGNPPESDAWLGSAFFILGLFMILNVYPAGNLTYVSFSIAPWLLWLLYQFSGQIKRLGMKAAVPVTLFLLYWSVFGLGANYRIVNFYHSEPVNPALKYHNLLPWPHGGLWIQDEHFTQIMALVKFVRQSGQRPDDLFILGTHLPVVYFLTEHQNPTAYDYYYFSRNSDGKDIIADLEKHRVRFIAMEPDLKPFSLQPALADYLQRNYEPRLSIAPHWLVLERVR